jgi:hypothetical protein
MNKKKLKWGISFFSMTLGFCTQSFAHQHEEKGYQKKGHHRCSSKINRRGEDRTHSQKSVQKIQKDIHKIEKYFSKLKKDIKDIESEKNCSFGNTSYKKDLNSNLQPEKAFDAIANALKQFEPILQDIRFLNSGLINFENPEMGNFENWEMGNLFSENRHQDFFGNRGFGLDKKGDDDTIEIVLIQPEEGGDKIIV